MVRHLVVDTDALSFMFRSDSRGLFYEQVLQDNIGVVSFMTISELHLWASIRNWGTKRRDEMEEFLNSFEVIHSSSVLCKTWSDVREIAQRGGTQIGVADAWIAATAVVLDCPLVTHNSKDFKMIKQIEIITSN